LPDRRHQTANLSLWEMSEQELFHEVIRLRGMEQRRGEKSRIPRLTAKSARRYVAVVAQELAAGRMSSAEARTCLYAAQLLLSSSPKP